jgi:hypothetical protein
MKAEEFNKLVEARLKVCSETLQKKADEYAASDDRLHNFKVAGAMLSCTPERALLGMAAKHLVSVFDIVSNIEHGKVPDDKLVLEKLTDTINYVILLEALVQERRK